MDVSGISGAGGLQQGRFAPAAGSQSPTGDSSFADLIQNLVEGTNKDHADVQQSVEDLVSGKSDGIHEVVMTASQAELSFRLMMEIRNRLISSYQEIIRMQV
ncbi:MAG: flagellar hook-basal body complex protein FliE [Fuerstiella sp.]